MPRLHPRQQLIREALAVGLSGLLAMTLIAWWSWSQPHTLAKPAPAHSQPNRTIRPVSSPSGPLWRPVTDTPIAQAPPPSVPTFRLITLSQRQGEWIALVDPGNGGPTERVRTGDRLADWLVSTINGEGVELRNGVQSHSLRFAP